MHTYLTFIGSVNLLGALLLLGAQNERFADNLLRRWTRMINSDEPCRNTPYLQAWLWWATIGTGFFGAINLVARGWPAEYARTIVMGNVYCYGSFEVLAIAMMFSPKWGEGKYLNHLLWIGQGGWGVAVLLRG